MSQRRGGEFEPEVDDGNAMVADISRTSAVAYAEFWKRGGGAGNSKNLRITKIIIKFFSTQNRSFSSPKSDEHKKN